MISTNTWNTSRANVRISHLFSIHDEAFALLIMMNNWSVWEGMANGEKRLKGKPSNTLFTNKTIMVNNVEMKSKGWSNEGLKEFNVILRYLVSVRNNIDIKTIEENLMEEYKQCDNTQLGKRKRKNNDELLMSERELPLDAYSLAFCQE